MAKFLRQNLFFWVGFSPITVKGRAREFVALLGGKKVYSVVTKEDEHIMLRHKDGQAYISWTPTSVLVRVPLAADSLDHETDNVQRECLVNIVEQLLAVPFFPMHAQAVTVSVPSVFLPVDEGTPDGTRAATHNFLEKMTHHTITNLDAVKMRIEQGNKEIRYSAVSDPQTKQYAIAVEVERRHAKARGLAHEEVIDIARHTRILADLAKEYQTLMPIA